MAATHLDAPLLRHTDDADARPIPPAIVEARADLQAIVGDILAIPESSLERDWAWIGGGEADVRYGIYRVHELLERAEVEAARSLRDAPDPGLAAALQAPATAARWDLHGVLAPLSSAVLDADPGGGEWAMRRTLGHIVGGQRAYAWASAWWQQAGYAVDDPALPPAVDPTVYADLPDDDQEAEGSIDDIRTRLDDILDLSIERLAALPDDRLAYGSRWSGFAVPIGFRMGRWSSHIREHTIQIEKTLVTLGRAPTELERLVRLTLAAYGRAEAVVIGRPDADEGAGVIRSAAAEARSTIADARLALET